MYICIYIYIILYIYICIHMYISYIPKYSKVILISSTTIFAWYFVSSYAQNCCQVANLQMSPKRIKSPPKRLGKNHAFDAMECSERSPKGHQKTTGNKTRKHCRPKQTGNTISWKTEKQTKEWKQKVKKRKSNRINRNTQKRRNNIQKIRRREPKKKKTEEKETHW